MFKSRLVLIIVLFNLFSYHICCSALNYFVFVSCLNVTRFNLVHIKLIDYFSRIYYVIFVTYHFFITIIFILFHFVVFLLGPCLNPIWAHLLCF